jgi:hypothetical protein
MLEARRGRGVLLCLLALSATARASVPPDASGTTNNSPTEERTKLVLRIEGPLGRERELALAGLLGSELAANRVTLHLERSSEPLLPWTASARRDPAALVLAILDVRDTNAWALYVVDAARGRAILRRLPGGEANAAALEEVSTILTSAVAAVREGLEVASKPVEAVVSDPPGGAPPAATKRPPQSPSASARIVAPSESERSERPSHPSGPFAAVLARGSTLSGRIVPGIAAEVGVHVASHLTVLAHGVADQSARLSTAFGAFDLGRSLAALEAGYAWPLGPVELEPRLGSGVEVIRRSRAEGAFGVSATPHETHARFAALAGVRVRYVVAGPLAVEFGADATFAPRRIRFTSGNTELASIPPISAGALAGLVLTLP